MGHVTGQKFKDTYLTHLPVSVTAQCLLLEPKSNRAAPQTSSSGRKAWLWAATPSSEFYGKNLRLDLDSISGCVPN